MIEDTYILTINDHFTVLTVSGVVCVGIVDEYVFTILIPCGDGKSEPLSEDTIPFMTYQVSGDNISFPDDQFDEAVRYSLEKLWLPGEDHSDEVIAFLRKHFELELASADLEAREYVKSLEMDSLKFLKDEYEEPMYRETGVPLDWGRSDVRRDFAEWCTEQKCKILTYADIMKELRNA